VLGRVSERGQLAGSGEVELCPDDAVSVAGGLGAPVVGSRERGDEVQPVRAVVGAAGPPGSAEVFDFDPDVGGVGLAADGEELAPALGVHDGVAGEFAGDQDQVLCGRAACQVGRDVAAYLAYLVSPAVEGALIPGGRVCWRGRGRWVLNARAPELRFPVMAVGMFLLPKPAGV